MLYADRYPSADRDPIILYFGVLSFFHFTEQLQSTCAIAAPGLIPSRPGYGYDHWRGLTSACGGGRTSAIVHSLLPVLDAGTLSLLLSAWLTQWTLLKPSLKLICSRRHS